jgi:hypothetical protein
MHVITQPAGEPIVFVEQWRTVDGRRECCRVLVLPEDPLPGNVVAMLGEVLRDA